MRETEQLFNWIDETTELIEKKESIPYLEALIVSTDLLFDPVLPEGLNEQDASKLKEQLERINLEDYTKEDRRKAMQLAILKGMKDGTQQQHFVTPDSIGLFLGYLIDKFTAKQDGITVFDPAVGTANLLLAVLNQLPDKDIVAFGSEVDVTLLRLAFNHTNLQEREIEFFHQDSLRPLLLDPVDVVVSDLPVGYYPDDANATSFRLRAEEGHSFAHHLFIEQSLKYAKPGAYLFLLIPSFLFQMDEKKQLNQFLADEAYIQSVLALPGTLFKNEEHAKSILILQKKGDGIEKPKNVFLADLPSFKEADKMNHALAQFNHWFNHDR